MRTAIQKLDRFYPAEDYHQKYSLRCRRALCAELQKLIPGEVALRESCVAMRLNAWCAGELEGANLADLLEKAGLAKEDAARIAALAGAETGGGPACGIGGH